MKSITKILIAEHDKNDLELLHEELKRGALSYIFEVVENKLAYVNALKYFKPDLILADYTFPSFDGPTAFKIREKMAPDTPFIFVSGTIGEERSIELIRNGVTDYALKDNLKSLTTKIERALKESKEKQQKIKLDEDLKRSEEKYRQITETAQEGIWLIDENNYTILVNKKMADILEYSIAEMMGKQNYHFMDDEWKKKASDHIANGRLGITENINFKYITKSGKVLWASLVTNPVFDDNGMYKGALAMVTDISKLKESEQRYSDLFQLSPQPMWVFETETLKFVQVNRAAIALYGYSEEEFMNMTLLDIKSASDGFSIELDQMQYADGAIFNQTLLHSKKSGDIIEVEIFSTSILINNKTFRSVIAFDVTEKNLFELNLTKAIIKTQEDERYEIGSELHDNVCQLLAVGQLNLEMLRKSLAESKIPVFNQCKESISSALSEIRNLSHRLAPVFFDDSTLHEAFKRLFNSFLVNDGCKFLLHFDDVIIKYPIPIELQLNLYRIMQEQFRNILKHSNATLIEVKVLLYNGKLKMIVTDNGIGFDNHDVKSGIGMANMKRRAELFSGKFEMNSSRGNGCEMVINIPLAEIN
ncbi:MAG: putative signal transduction histidine kinase [Chitinophagaceae bacterium]|nr:putative signal transduction histidine kinase [Chitinophagaceae bacterium]